MESSLPSEDEELRVPLYYIVDRNISREEEEAVAYNLRLTPPEIAFVSNVYDTDLAFRLAGSVSLMPSHDYACLVAAKIATEYKRPVLVIGEADNMEAVYSSEA